MIERAYSVATLDSLRGIEGAAGAHYFKLFPAMIHHPWTFSGRSKRPPQDPVNAILSFGYVIVGSQLQSLLDGAGLDPYLGFYHAIDYGRPSLALDLVEEFRHPLVDRLTATLFNQNIMDEDDFFQHPSGGIYLNTSGKRKFFIHYQKTLGEILPGGDPFGSEESKAFFPLFQQQISKLVKAIQENVSYEPFRFM